MFFTAKYPVRQQFPENFVFKGGQKKKELVQCAYCGEACETKFCSNKCQMSLRSKNKYQDYINNNDKYCRSNFNPVFLKPVLLKEQNNECAVCKIENKWNGKSIAV